MLPHQQNPEYTAEKNLAREVSVRNEINTFANELRLHFRDALMPYVGKKVVKVTPYTTWTAKVKDSILPIEKWMEEQKVRIVYEFYYSSVLAKIDKTFPISECSVKYVKQYLSICELNDCILTSGEIINKKYRTNYTADEVVSTRNKIRELEQEIGELKSFIGEFS